MKTLDEIINRTDYKTINAALKERCFELARIIYCKMKDLDLERISVNGETYVRTHTTSSVDTCYYLGVCRDVDGYGEYCLSLEQDYFEYYTGDFSAAINPASSKDFLCFLNNVREILNMLDDIETSQSDEIRKVMESTNDIKNA